MLGPFKKKTGRKKKKNPLQSSELPSSLKLDLTKSLLSSGDKVLFFFLSMLQKECEDRVSYQSGGQHQSLTLNLGCDLCVVTTPAWHVALLAITMSNNNQHTQVLMTAKRPLFYFISLFYFFLFVFELYLLHLHSTRTPRISSNLRLIDNLVDAKPFGRGSHQPVTVARTKARRTRAAWPQWEEGGRGRGCCHSRFSPAWELQG